jgi:hypothetical protein
MEKINDPGLDALEKLEARLREAGLEEKISHLFERASVAANTAHSKGLHQSDAIVLAVQAIEKEIFENK